MDSSIVIRQVQPEELSTLRAFAEERFIEAFSSFNTMDDMKAYVSKQFAPKQIAKELARKDSKFFFGIHSDQIVGYLKFNSGSAQTDRLLDHAMEIERIYVKSSHQNMKIGQQLLDFAISLAAKEGTEQVWLGVWEKNENAIRFYLRNGFVQFGSHEFLLGRDRQTDILMKRVLA